MPRRAKPVSPSTPASSFRLWLQNAARDRQLTQKELAHQAGISPQTLNSWSIGRRQPKAPNLMRLAHALGVDPHEVFAAVGLPLPPAPVVDARRQHLIDLLLRVDLDRFERFETLEADLQRYLARDQHDRKAAESTAASQLPKSA